MKKITSWAVCLVFALGLYAVPAAAQTIGFKIGPTFSNLDIEDQEDGDQLTSFGGGGFIRFGMAGLSLQAELLAVTKGTSFEDVIGDADAELKLDYIEVPVTAMFSFGRGPYLFAGPAVGFEIGCEGSVGGLSGECDENDGERKEVDVSLVGGAGIEFPLGPGSLLLEGRYSHGLTDLNDDPDTGSGSMRTRYFALFAGYAISLSR